MNKLHRYFVIFWQYFEWVVLHIFTLVWRFEVRLPGKFPDRPFLMVTNHKSMVDPWFFVILMPLRIFRRHPPYSFVASQAFPLWFRVFLKLFIYFPNGVRPLPKRRGDGKLTIDEKVSTTLEALNNKDIALIFPEGHVFKKEGIGEFKRGAAYIQEKTGVPIILGSIRFSKHRFLPGSWWGLPWVKRTIKWAGNSVYVPKEILHNNDTSGEWLRKQVEELYSNI